MVTGKENVKKNRLPRMSSSKVDRFSQTKTKIISGPFYTYGRKMWKCLGFVTFVCNLSGWYRRGSPTAVQAW